VNGHSPLSCEVIRGEVFRSSLGRSLTPDELEDIVRALQGPPVWDLRRRWDEEERVFSVDWRQGRVAYTAGLYKDELTFVNLSFTGVHALDAEPVTAAQAVDCFGPPSQVQAWYDWYPDLSTAGLYAALVFIPQRAIAFAVRHYSPAPEKPPLLDGSLPIHMTSIFGERWAEEQRVLAKSDPWPGDWARVQVETIRHDAPPTPDDDEAAE
jgi:hypothetical protein